MAWNTCSIFLFVIFISVEDLYRIICVFVCVFVCSPIIALKFACAGVHCDVSSALHQTKQCQRHDGILHIFKDVFTANTSPQIRLYFPHPTVLTVSKGN
jgi:hypothetical protein